jgi:hypothetical protein
MMQAKAAKRGAIYTAGASKSSGKSVRNGPGKKCLTFLFFGLYCAFVVSANNYSWLNANQGRVAPL